MQVVTSLREKFFLIGVFLRESEREEALLSLNELKQLVYSADSEVVAKELVSLRHYDPALFLTRGKAEQLALQARFSEATGVIFDNELAPAQQRNLEDLFQLKIIDRTTLILDIFARHAHSHEGKIQVELAQLNYLLPRLRGSGSQLSRLAGGIGTRGPGETKLETDRRKIKNRIYQLNKELNRLRQYRTTQRKQRLRSGLPLIAIIGYTNTGKSSLLNLLAHADVLVEDKLFATLDPTVRRVFLSDGTEVLMSDTVGFIKKLPTTVVAAFRATLEETNYAHLLLQVVDASQPNPEREISATQQILSELKLLHKPMITIFNKIDLVEDRLLIKPLIERYYPAVAISVKTGEGIESLQSLIIQQLQEIFKSVLLYIPYTEADKFYQLLPPKDHNFSIDYLNDCLKVQARLTQEELHRLPSHWLSNK